MKHLLPYRGMLWPLDKKWEILSYYLPEDFNNVVRPLSEKRRHLKNGSCELWVHLPSLEEPALFRHHWLEVPQLLDRMELFLIECHRDLPPITLQSGIFRRYELLRDNINWKEQFQHTIADLQLIADLTSKTYHIRVGWEAKSMAITIDDFTIWLTGLRNFVNKHSKE